MSISLRRIGTPMLFGLLLAVSFMGIHAQTAQAYSGGERWPNACTYSNWNEGELSHGFFSNSCPPADQVMPYRGVAALAWNGALTNQDCISYGYVIPRRDGGCDRGQPTAADALSGVRTKQDLYNKLEGYYNGRDRWAQKGAAFVVRTLLGQPAGSSTNLTGADWASLQRRLVDNPAVTISGVRMESVSANTTSVYMADNKGYNAFSDAKINQLDFSRYYGSAQTIPVITLSYPGGNYKLEVKCANPLGSLAGLPDFAPTYTLTPGIDTVSPDPVEAGGTVKIASHIDYSGNVTSRDTQWQINQIVTKPGGVSPSNTGGGTSNSRTDPCEYYGNRTDCRGFGATGSGTYNRASTTLAEQTSPSLDYPVGTKICYGLSVQPRDQGSDEWAHSALVCVVIGVKPKVQILGGDLSVGRAFSGANVASSKVNTGVSAKANGTFGSWVEYGIFAPSGIAMASAGGLANGNGGTSNASVLTTYGANQLTFANNGAAACRYGCYSTSNLGSIPDVASKYISASTPTTPGSGATISLDSLSAGVHAYTGNIALSAATMPAGKYLVIRATGTITIDGNLQYTNARLRSNEEIPQLILIANRININPNVTQVDSWLIAKSTAAAGTGGIIDTCARGGYSNGNYTAGLTGAVCNGVLMVNGPVMAEKLWLRRTGGSGTGNDSGKPAEIFNLRPDAYLWAQTQVTGSSRIQTTYTKELAPRF